MHEILYWVTEQKITIESRDNILVHGKLIFGGLRYWKLDTGLNTHAS